MEEQDLEHTEENLSMSIITPVWNQSHLTSRFLTGHWGIYEGWNGIEWVIIDNGSTDDTPTVLGHWKQIMGDKLKVITLPENIGFGPGNNQGVKVATGDIFVFLSNDVRTGRVIGKKDEGYISLVREAVQSNKNALYGPELFSHDTGWNTFEDVGPIPYVAGWCVIAARSLWKKIGPWDERFIPCDYEDMDLSFNAAKLGYPLVHISLPLLHDSGKSAEKLPGGRLQITLENRKRFMEKWVLYERD